MGKPEGELQLIGFQQNTGTNWSRKHDTVQIVRSSESHRFRVTWREEWKDYLAIIFDYSDAGGPVCVVPTQVLFNSTFVNQKRKEQSYVNSGNYWSQIFNFEDDLPQLVLRFENRWDILGGKLGQAKGWQQTNGKKIRSGPFRAHFGRRHSDTSAQLTCTMEDFHVFIEDKIKNNIPNLTRKSRATLNKVCQHCNKEVTQIDSAHVHGFERDTIIDNIIKKYVVDDKEQIIQVDLHKVVQEIFDAHLPINEHFMFLCPKCHRDYDNGLWV